MRLTRKISLSLVFLFIALAFTIETGYSATQKTFILNWSNPVFNYEEYALNDSSTTKDLLFSTSENKTVWIRMPKNSTVIFANMSLTGTSSPTLSSAIEPIHSVAIGNVNTTTSDNEIVVGVDNYVKLLNNLGGDIWSYQIDGISFYDVAIGNISANVGNEIVSGTSNSEVIVINASGNEIWNATVYDQVLGVAVGNVNTSLEWDEIAAASDKLYLFNSTGGSLWNYSSTNSFRAVAIGNISSDNGNEIVAGTGSPNSTVFVFDSSGNLKWSKYIGNSINHLAIGNVNASNVDNEIGVACNNGSVILLDNTGNVLWSYATSSGVNSVAIGDLTDDSGDEVVAGSNDKTIYIINATGQLVWSYTTSNWVRGIDVGNLTADPGNEVAAGTKLPATNNLYVLNFQYYPTNISLDIGNDGDSDWSTSGKLRSSTTLTNSTLAPAIQDFLTVCTSKVCNVSFVFHSDYGGDLNITSINITYDYNASETIDSSQLNVWARTNNTFVNETIGNQSINISYKINPANSIQIRYVNINSAATSCSFGGISYSNLTINGQNLCNLTTYRNVDFSGSLPSSDLLWDDSMSSGIPVYSNESSVVTIGSGFWMKNITIWNVTSTIFYNVTANTTLDLSSISNQGLYVDWYSNGTFYDITPATSTNTCNSTTSSYTTKTVGVDNFYVCKQDTNSDGRIDFFKWKQPHTSVIVYTVNSSTNSPPNLTNSHVNPPSGKWDLQSFNFTIDVNDTEADNVTVKFWLKIDGLKWQMIESKNITGNGTLEFNATSNKSWVSGSWYKFEYQDFNSTGYIYHDWQNTSNFTGPTILKHNVSMIYIAGNNTNVNKTGSNTTFLSVVANDTDVNQNISGVNCGFWITIDGSMFIIANTTTTNGTGHCNFSFDPNSSYSAGQQFWKVGPYLDDYYYDTNSTNYTVNVFGELRINFTDYFINRNFTRGNNVTFLAKLTDEYNNIVATSDYNCTWYVNNSQKENSLTNSSGYCNYTWPTGCSGSGVYSTLGVYTINVTLSGGNSSYYTITSNQVTTNDRLKDNLSISIVRPQSNQIIHEQDTIALNSTVSDSCGAPSGYTVNWYLLKSGACPTGNPITTGDNTTWQLNWTCYPRIQTIIANATGEVYYSGQSSVQTNIYGWASVDIKTPPSSYTINRTELVDGESYNFVCYVEDVNATSNLINTYPVNFWYSNSTATYSIGRNTTVSNGNATYIWNVSNERIAEGLYTVKCNITDNSTLKYNASVLEDSSTDVEIVGNSDNRAPEFLEVTSTSAKQYVENVTINANVSDTYGVSKVWVNITYPNSTNYTYYLVNTSANMKRGIWNISFNFTTLGDYDYILYANDTTNNIATTTGWFEVYSATVQFYGNMTDAVSNNVTVDFIFYRNGTSHIIHTNNTSSTSPQYNLTIRKRIYDIEFKIFNDTVKFLGVNVTSNLNNSINFDNIPQNKIPLTLGVRNRLVGLAIANTINFSTANITLNFTSATQEGSRYFPSDVDIYRCSNWDFSLRNCTSTPTNLGGTPLPAADPKVVTVTTQSLSAFFAGDTPNPTDGYCDTGESCTTEPACCGGTNNNPGNTGGNTGGGSSSSAICGNNKCETGENRDNCPQDCGTPDMLFSLRTNLTDVQLDMGKEDTYSLWITNNLNADLNTSISIVGTVQKFTTLEKTTLTIGPKKEEIVKIYVKIPNDADPGAYTGQMSVVGNGKTQSIPLTITVSLQGEVYLDVVVQALGKKVNINDTAKFHITLYDMGFRKRLNVDLNYIIKEYESNKIVYEENETKLIESTQSYQKAIPLSNINNITAGRYFFEVRAKYDSKIAMASDDFEITKSFWTTRRVNTAVIITLVTTSAVSVFYTRKRYIQWKFAKARYIFPLDFNKMPKGRIWLGKIAETSKRAYFDMNDLRTHVLTAGATGSGKSVSACIFVEELLREKIPVIVFDPTAQWTGFVRPCRDANLMKYYKEFGMSVNDTRPYTGMIYEITDPNVKIDFKKYMIPGEITVFTLNKLKPGEYDVAVKNIIDTIFTHGWEESTKIKMVVVFDEVHRLLERYGGTGGYIALEKACREFRKWGIGLIMASQVLSDFKEAIKGNVLTEIQLHTKSLGDLSRIEKKYGLDYVKRVTKLEIGVGMMQNPKYNDGKPWFVAFRPTYHEPHKITDIELETYKEYAALIDIIESNIEAIEKSGKDVFDLRTELKLAKDKLKKGRFRMAKIYIDSLRKHLNIGEGNA